MPVVDERLASMASEMLEPDEQWKAAAFGR
jgi:hypothetical protein